VIAAQKALARTTGRDGFSPAVPALLGAMAIWGGSYVVTKFALVAAGPFTVLWLRLAIAAAVMSPFAARRGFRFRMAFRREYIVFGFTGMALHLGLEILGLEFTSASSAALIIAAAPAVTVGFSVAFLKERLSLLQGIGIALSVVGVVLITGAPAPGGYPFAWLGNLLVFGGVVMWGIYTVQGRKMVVDQSWLVATTAATLSAVVMVLPVMFGEIALKGAPTFTTSSIAAVIFLGLFASATAYGLYNLALKYVGGSVVGPYISLVPVIGVVLALLVGETLTALQLVGGATVAVGVWLSHRGAPPSA
jgi:drug/metabolite transporter (DMT)-like permease